MNTKKKISTRGLRLKNNKKKIVCKIDVSTRNMALAKVRKE